MVKNYTDKYLLSVRLRMHSLSLHGNYDSVQDLFCYDLKRMLRPWSLRPNSECSFSNEWNVTHKYMFLTHINVLIDL